MQKAKLNPPTVRKATKLRPEELAKAFEEAEEHSKKLVGILRAMCTPTDDDLRVRVR